ncbi:MAG: TusE/DsrC/DsvC family sulfur relay protein [Bacteroidia bacterium]|nr:TusE/DsrC/DsvC family sulfur relay protein [Bacteroidia bacterium]
MEKIIVGNPVNVNEEGYLTNFSQWNRSVGESIAREEGIELTEEHWKVLSYLQDQHKQNVPLSIRKIGNSGVVSIKDFYRLFPKGPLKISSKIAGIPKPASCI